MNNKIIIFYHYFELDLIYQDNLIHFLKFGYSTHFDIIIVISGTTLLSLPEYNNIRYVYVENKNMDIGTFVRVIKQININLYEYYFFMNCTVRGPYLPAYFNTNWTDIYISKFEENIGIVGNTINILSKNSGHYSNYILKYNAINCTHVQSYLYVLNKKSIRILINNNFYDNFELELSKEEIIVEYEIRLTQIILSHNLSIKCILNEYNKIDYLNEHNDINKTSVNGDILFINSYFGRTIHPLEVVFIKTNRGLVNYNYLDKLSIYLYNGLDRLNSNQIFFDNTKLFNRLSNLNTSVGIVDIKESYTADEILQLILNLINHYPEYKKIIHNIIKTVNN